LDCGAPLANACASMAHVGVRERGSHRGPCAALAEWRRYATRSLVERREREHDRPRDLLNNQPTSPHAFPQLEQVADRATEGWKRIALLSASWHGVCVCERQQNGLLSPRAPARDRR